MNVNKIRKDFPILKRRINKKPLVYLDSAATSQKPRQVLEAMDDYYKNNNANVHRGIHTLSVEATELMENARKKAADFVGVKDVAEIIFVRNATEAINLVAYSWGRLNISKGDEIVLTVAEHHSNFVVWQQLVKDVGAVLKIVPVVRQSYAHPRGELSRDRAHPGGVNVSDEDGQLDLEAFKKALTKKTKLVTFFHVSNVLGTINPVKKLVKIARMANGDRRMAILVDGAQAVPHMPVDIPSIGCDFYVFTGHKMLGPTGIGVLWGKREILEKMPPFLFGGEMISKVSLNKSTWNELPWKFEAGTPNIAGAIGLGAAVDYLAKIGMENVREHEIELTEYALKRLSEIPEVTIYGPPVKAHPRGVQGRSQVHPGGETRRAGVVSFNVGDSSTHSARTGSTIHAHDAASILDSEGIAIRSGHHCAQPLMDFLGISSAARASFYIYNTREEVDRLVEGIEKVKKTFKMKS